MIERIEPLLQGWWHWMHGVSLQLALLVGLVAVLDGIGRRRGWTGLRQALWSLVLLKLLLPPDLSSPASVVHLAGPGALASPARPATLSASGLLFIVWSAGVVVFSVLAIRRHVRLRRACLAGARDPDVHLLELARTVRARLAMRRGPGIRISPDASSPVLLGFLRPLVVLPEALLREGDRQTLEHVLMHESAHFKRRDHLATLTVLALQLLYWFHPLVWLTRRRLSDLRELACDATVASVLREETGSYRSTLLELARPLLDVPAPAGGLSVIPPRSRLLERLDQLARPRTRHPRLRRLATLSVFTLLAISCVPLAPREPIGTQGARQAPLPPLDQLQGCLQLRFAVMQALAADRQASSR